MCQKKVDEVYIISAKRVVSDDQHTVNTCEECGCTVYPGGESVEEVKKQHKGKEIKFICIDCASEKYTGKERIEGLKVTERKIGLPIDTQKTVAKALMEDIKERKKSEALAG
jgi:hypothetical protein